MQHHKKVPQARLSQGLQPQKPPPQKNAPLSAAVESDVVGYTTIEMQAGSWYLLGASFATLDGTSSYTVNEVFQSGDFATGDILYTLDSSGLFQPHYWNEQNAKWSKNRIALIEDTTEYPISSAVYLQKMTEGQLIMSGKVEAFRLQLPHSDGATSVSLVALPYPQSLSLNEYNWTGFGSGDCLYTLNDSGVFVPHYWNEKEQKWSTNRLVMIDDTTPLKVGQAVYLQKSSNGEGTVSVK